MRLKKLYLFFSILLILFIFSSFVLAKNIHVLKDKKKDIALFENKQNAFVAVSEYVNSNGGAKVFIKFKEDYKPNSDFIKKYQIKNRFNKGLSAFVDISLLNELSNSSLVESISLISTKQIFLQDSLNLVNASLVQRLVENSSNLTGLGQTVCIIDTGINYNHPDLGGCYGNNSLSSSCKVIGGWDYCADDHNCTSQDSDPIDVNGHGTHVAGIVAANGFIKGVAPDSKIVMIKASNSTGTFWDDDLIKALEWCVNNASKFNITVISMSLGGEAYDSYCDSYFDGDGVPNWDNFNYVGVINAARAKNISVVVAAGNDGYYNAVSAPACIKNSSAITSTNKTDDVISYFANTWNESSLFILAAPGDRIYSTYNGSYEIASGTSMATPHVAGAIAIMNQYLKSVGGNKSSKQIEEILNNTGKQVYDTYANRYFSRINVYDAIISLDEDKPNVNLIGPFNGSISKNKNQTFSCNATDLGLKNMTFYVWNSTGIYNSTNKDISGASDVYSVDLTNMPFTNYTWNCYYYDLNGNLGRSSNYTLSVDNAPIQITINLPVNNSWNNGNFSINVSEQGNCSYSLNDGTNVSMNTSDNLSFSALNQSLVQDSYYDLTFYCQDLAGNLNSTSSSFYYDSVAPIVNITGNLPSDETSNSVDKIFYYNVSDNLNLTDCFLVVNGLNVLYNETIITNETNNFKKIFTPGVYNWQINCTDEAGNIGNSSLQSFTITALPTQRTSGGGSSGGGVSSPPFVDEKEILSGVTKSLFKGNSLKFSLGNVNHTLMLANISNSSILITIRSDPINLSLNVGEIKKINLSSKDYYDLMVKLEDIGGNKANITLQQINEVIFENKIMKNKEDDLLVLEKDRALPQKDKESLGGYILFLFVAVALLFFIRKINFKKIKKKFK